MLGSGSVALTPAARFPKHGYIATMGTRDAAKPAAWHGQNYKAYVGSISGAQPLGKLWVLAVKGHGGSGGVACRHKPEPGLRAGDGFMQSDCRLAAE